MSSFSTFFKWSAKERRFFFRALLTLLYIRIQFMFFSFAKLQKRYGIDSKATGENVELALLIRDAIRRAGKIGPWKNKCLVHTLAARRMLNAHKLASHAYLGVQLHSEDVNFAHAWINASGIEIVARIEDYTKAHEF